MRLRIVELCSILRMVCLCNSFPPPCWLAGWLALRCAVLLHTSYGYKFSNANGHAFRSFQQTQTHSGPAPDSAIVEPHVSSRGRCGFTEMEMQASGPYISLSSSFNPRINGNLTAIAARVAENSDSNQGAVPRLSDGGERDSDFSFSTPDLKLCSPIPADEIFHNGKILPVYRDVATLEIAEFCDEKVNENEIRNSDFTDVPSPLRMLFVEEMHTQRTTSSSSSSSGNESVTVEEETRWKKIGFHGFNSKIWKFRDLLHKFHNRHGSRGAFMFLNQSHSVRTENDKDVKEFASTGREFNSAPLPMNNGDGRQKHVP
ncbi:uncharacterized protein LOC127253022 isoform X2 [Andrographis paniculata]|uniref:uncharacterized protein LOC127253022 isoform X2 n=1 Tax=Andrographis paniculata TaxID=175694 RepID=UPI0021E8F813|nr:uncharacterized protein LOC127253022 isoform X2 [Andrographis paniculata]XP_051133385.1 uncharacterized protein LOC127253022 isoform X2 [Andrographis paniculata]